MEHRYGADSQYRILAHDADGYYAPQGEQDAYHRYQVLSAYDAAAIR